MPVQPLVVTTTTGNLATILGSTLPFTSRGEEWDHPGISGVQIHAGGGVIAATATNRYVLGHARKAASGELPRGFFLLKNDATLVRETLSSVIEKRRASGDLVTITVTFDADTPARIAIDFCTITIRLDAGTPIKQIEDLDSLLAMLPAPHDLALSDPCLVAPYAIAPLTEAAEWSKMGGRNVPLRWSFAGPHKPARVEIEDWFVAAVMPIKGPTKEPSVPTSTPRAAAALLPAGQA
ncbi:MAG TPA: hypothetical protein VGD39_09705 [Nocardioides sp.]